MKLNWKFKSHTSCTSWLSCYNSLHSTLLLHYVFISTSSFPPQHLLSNHRGYRGSADRAVHLLIRRSMIRSLALTVCISNCHLVFLLYFEFICSFVSKFQNFRWIFFFFFWANWIWTQKQLIWSGQKPLRSLYQCRWDKKCCPLNGNLRLNLLENHSPLKTLLKCSLLQQKYTCSQIIESLEAAATLAPCPPSRFNMVTYGSNKHTILMPINSNVKLQNSRKTNTWRQGGSVHCLWYS